MMEFIIGFVIGLLVGGFVGLLVGALAMVAQDRKDIGGRHDKTGKH